jgi:hypothetical protein
MEIKFEQQGLLYVAEFEVASNCNLHIERESRGAFTIAQRGTKQGKYAYITDENYDDRTTIDVDMLGNLYPKYIRVTSVSKPTYAEVNFAEEGGGSGDITYFDLTDILSSGFNILDAIDYLGGMLKAKVTNISGATNIEKGDVIIFPSPMIYKLLPDMSLEPMGVGVCLSDMICIQKQTFTVEEVLKELLTTEFFDRIPRITKEEFYNLNV